MAPKKAVAGEPLRNRLPLKFVAREMGELMPKRAYEGMNPVPTQSAPEIPPAKPVYSVSEFATLFNRHKSWAYRLIYAGRIDVISDFGLMMIPASEEFAVPAADDPGIFAEILTAAAPNAGFLRAGLERLDAAAKRAELGRAEELIRDLDRSLGR